MQDKPMHVSHVTVPFEKLAEVLGLPPTAKVVGVKEHHEGAHLVVRVVADMMPTDCFLGPEDSLTKIGESYKPKQAAGGVQIGGTAPVVEGEAVDQVEVPSEDHEDTPLAEIIPPTVVS